MASLVLAKAKTKLVINDPFYATLVMSLKTVETEEVGGRPLWLAATDGNTLYINPKNFDQLPLQEAVAVLKHEAMHVAQLHPFRRQHRTGKRWNHAADYVINDAIKKEGGQLPAGGLHDPCYAGMSAEQVYNALPPEDEQDGGESGGERGMDEDIIPAPDQSEAAQAQAKANVQKAVNVAKAMGKMPASIEAELADILNPKVDWKEQLRRFMTDVATTDYSFAKINRRYMHAGLSLPAKAGIGAMRKLGVVIDTSGSVGDDELRQYFGEIAGAVEECCPSSLVIVYCDAQVNAVDEMERPEVDQLKPRRVGGGGTDLRKATDYLGKHHEDCAAVIVLTDGYTPFPATMEVPSLWAITTGVVSPVGETIHVQLG